MKNRTIINLTRGEEIVEVPVEQWGEILLFLTTHGWVLSRPSIDFLGGHVEISSADARLFAESGKIILDETRKDPLTAYQVIRFDMGKFAEIIYFCESGAFSICR